jgi:hypothetical protein
MPSMPNKRPDIRSSALKPLSKHDSQQDVGCVLIFIYTTFILS